MDDPNVLQYLNILIIPVLAWAIIIERRIMRIELTMQLAEQVKASCPHAHRRHDDPPPT